MLLSNPIESNIVLPSAGIKLKNFTNYLASFSPDHGLV